MKITKRTILCGDVHGCLAELDELLEQVAYQKTKDRLIFVGDLVDRGPDSAGVVKRAQELGAECVLGNHEEKHLRWKKWEDKVQSGTAPKNPMASFNEHKIAIQEGLSDDDFAWLSNLPRTLRVGEHGGRNYVAVHGGLEPKYAFDKQGKQVIRIRFCDVDSGSFKGSKYIGHQPDNTQYWSELWTGPESVFYGHAVWEGLPRFDNHGDYVCWGLDTGCVFGGRLTAALLEPGGECVGFSSVPAHETYFEYRAPRE